MSFVVTIVGRPNVGKSTLFNRLTRSKHALVSASPGMTRDRNIAAGQLGSGDYLVIDTGGVFEDDSPLGIKIHEQALAAATDADMILLMVDARSGPLSADRDLVRALRPFSRNVILVVNKVDFADALLASAEFHELGLGEPLPLSAKFNSGIEALVERIDARIPPGCTNPRFDETRTTRIAVIGRPNVGKSTLVNRLLGEQRMITSDRPGTTRDAIATDFQHHGQSYTLVDTAGIRRRARVTETAEKFSVVAALTAIDYANVVVLLIDAQEGITEQDTGLLGLILNGGRALVIAVNKWDGLSDAARQTVRSELNRRLHFIDYVEIRHLSALHGSGVGNLLKAVDNANRSAFVVAPTAQITDLLKTAVANHPPPLVRGRRPKLRYAHLGASNPPTIIIHGSRTENIAPSYRRYLAACFRSALGLTGTPVRIILRQSENPYAGRTNQLTSRQVAKRRRLMRHVKRRK